MKNFTHFNENKTEKMTDSIRKKIISKIKALEVDTKSEKEQDKYIKKFCKELGFTFEEFYATDGKKLNNMLSVLSEQKIGDYGIGVDIDNEYSKIINGSKGSKLDLGKVGQVPEASLYNIKQTYKDATIKIVDDHYILIRK